MQGRLPSPISDRHRECSAWHPNGTQGNALGCINIHASIMHKHTYMHSHDDAYSLTCAGGIYADTHCSVHQNMPTYTLRDIIRSPYLKIGGNSENKASSKAKWGETGRWGWEGGGLRWKTKGGHPTRGKGVESGGKKISDVLRCPSCRFGSSATYLSWSVALCYPPLTLRFSCSHLIMGLLLAEIATVWQSWAHSGASEAYSHLGSVVKRWSSSWDSSRTEVWGRVSGAASQDLVVIACSVGVTVWGGWSQHDCYLESCWM